MDGIPGLDPYALSRAAGILTDWRIVGPLGRHALLDFDQSPITVTATLRRPHIRTTRSRIFSFPTAGLRCRIISHIVGCFTQSPILRL